jgi:uncharacterized damage-inducible protein DinB
VSAARPAGTAATAPALGPSQAQALARYNQWMNERLYECCAGLTDEERRRDRRAFFRSIHGTLNHLLVSDRIWMARFTGRSWPPASLDTELFADFDALRGERASMDDTIVEWAATLAPEDFARELSYTSVVNPQPRRYPFWFAVTHFFNHQTHHRGQVTTLLSQAGVDPGVTDLIWLPEFQAAQR